MAVTLIRWAEHCDYTRLEGSQTASVARHKSNALMEAERGNRVHNGHPSGILDNTNLVWPALQHRGCALTAPEALDNLVSYARLCRIDNKSCYLMAAEQEHPVAVWLKAELSIGLQLMQVMELTL